ncbi:MAG: hypothetical protein SF182_29845 [Deltaproteobacteria bacterium]|nr:hypothetical protein [Deltaproteobacteria bacterium]
MIAAYLAGARLALSRWALISILWLITAAFGVAFALAGATWLGDALDGAMATKSLLHHVDVQVLIDLWAHHREGLRMLLVLAAVLAVGHTVLWWWLDGVIVAAVLPSGDGFWRRGAQLAPVMARLFGIGVCVWLTWSLLIGGAAWGLMRLTQDSFTAHVWEWIGGLAAALWLLGTAWLIAAHDQARIRAALSGSGAIASYRWALGFVGFGGERAFALALLLQGSGLGLWALYQAIGLALPLTELIGLTWSILWGELFLWLRAFGRVWRLAAQRKLQ